ncbi:SGNH/GDSL hydrolase family protein [Paenibacillus urinalis]|uniref:SGNH/GDSL hydrolase family protein n=1 Tax=Paenibacillus urinalis TaxID=521520 RepID=UPI002368098C|nr:SGNH/GDSL hydrolase family protein [Paenibacillus urinalis]WDH96379.1 SGNH/GDSL hydrolase family protein [Paenibacillus urinalis]
MENKRRKILFQGDSITDGNWGRNLDPNHILGHGYVYIIAAQLGSQYAESQPYFMNRGVSGNRVSDVYARWNEDAISLQPDLISLLVGVNDVHSIITGSARGATDRYERIYRQMLDETREVLPDTEIVLCEPFVMHSEATDKDWSEWSSKMEEYRSVVRHLAEDYNTLFVPLQETFNQAANRADTAYWVWDGIHPTTAGHQLIANEWLKVVQQSKYAIG